MTYKRATVLLVPLATVTIAIGALSGCAPATHASTHHTKTPAAAGPTTTPTPTPTPATPGSGPLPADALFRISATATQPNGATVDLVQTVFAPVVATPSDTSLLNAQCNIAGSPDWQMEFPKGFTFVTATMTATPESGSPVFDSDAAIAAYFGFGTSAYSGSYRGAQAQCAPGYIDVPGTIHAVAPAPSDNPVSGTYGWASPNARYGFAGDDGSGGGGTTVVKDCAVQVSDGALAAVPALAQWKTQVYTDEQSCGYTP